jgi:protein-tyrosine phosphatase
VLGGTERGVGLPKVMAQLVFEPFRPVGRLAAPVLGTQPRRKGSHRGEHAPDRRELALLVFEGRAHRGRIHGHGGESARLSTRTGRPAGHPGTERPDTRCGGGAPVLDDEDMSSGGFEDLDLDADPAIFRICFVCTGNICRSAMAEAIFRRLIADGGYAGRIAVESAATGDWHVGEPADPRTIAALTSRGYDGSTHRARQFDPDWFAGLDLIVAFDRGQERTLREWATGEPDRAKVQLLMTFEPDGSGTMDVPDPYYSDAALFESVLATIERASVALFRQLEPGIRQGVS